MATKPYLGCYLGTLQRTLETTADLRKARDASITKGNQITLLSASCFERQSASPSPMETENINSDNFPDRRKGPLATMRACHAFIAEQEETTAQFVKKHISKPPANEEAAVEGAAVEGAAEERNDGAKSKKRWWRKLAKLKPIVKIASKIVEAADKGAADEGAADEGAADEGAADEGSAEERNDGAESNEPWWRKLAKLKVKDAPGNVASKIFKPAGRRLIRRRRNRASPREGGGDQEAGGGGQDIGGFAGE